MKLGSGVPLETEHRLIRRHAAAVVNDLDERASGVLYHHSHLIRPGIYGILHELLHHGRRSLHDLSRSYHVRYIAW